MAGWDDTEYVTSFLPLLLVGLMVAACCVFSGATARGRKVETAPETPTTSSGSFMASF